MQPKQTNAAGFTLIEILAVIVILGILTTVVAVNVSNYTDKTRVRTTRLTIDIVRTAIITFEMELARYPTSLEELILEGDEDWPGPFLDVETIPRDGWGNELTYEIRNKRVRVTSAGRDGEFGTDDDLWK